MGEEGGSTYSPKTSSFQQEQMLHSLLHHIFINLSVFFVHCPKMSKNDFLSHDVCLVTFAYDSKGCSVHRLRT